ncbi:MAG: 50S ribosomal protein L23 [Candidatus Magasanikbacteria bacterium]
MGLLDRWAKKQDAEKLKSNVSEKTGVTKSKKSVVVKKADNVKSDSTAVIPNFKSKTGGISYKILSKALVTEKSAIAESNNKYSFVVSRFATKGQISQAVKEAYGIKPKAINVINVNGRNVRFGKSKGRRSDYRKAIVTLPKGQTISIHKGV